MVGWYLEVEFHERECEMRQSQRAPAPPLSDGTRISGARSCKRVPEKGRARKERETQDGLSRRERAHSLSPLGGENRRERIGSVRIGRRDHTQRARRGGGQAVIEKRVRNGKVSRQCSQRRRKIPTDAMAKVG
jgi:hypothetical protein